MSVDDLFGAIDDCFLDSSKLEKVAAFTRAQRQVEGWFKGELIYLFDALLGENRISTWEPEARLGDSSRKRCDFVVGVDGTPVFLELKALYHGEQRAARFGLDIYLYKDDVGIWGDVVKLAGLSQGVGYNLLFIYPRPDPTVWTRQIDAYKRRIAPISLREASRIGEYPGQLYICKMEIERSNT